MLGTDGNPLRSADGKIVLADDLYPMVPAQSYIWGHRFGTPAGQWTAEWETVEAAYDLEAYYTWGTQAGHSAFSIVMGTNTIDWARVKKITWTIPGYFEIQAGLTLKVTKSKNNSTFPAGTVIRDDWDTVAEYTETTGIIDVSFTIEWDINGVEPTSLEFALMFTADEGSNDGAGYASSYNTNYSQARIVYNLATA